MDNMIERLRKKIVYLTYKDTSVPSYVLQKQLDEDEGFSLSDDYSYEKA